MNFYKPCLAAALSVLLSGHVLAVPATQPIDDAVAHLGNSDPAVRERSAKILRDAGAGARPALEAAAKGDDPEIAARAREILHGVPNTPAVEAANPADNLPEVINYRMSQRQMRQQLIGLLQNQPNGIRALTRIWLIEKNQDLRGRIFDALLTNPSASAGALLADGNVASAELLLDAAVDRQSAESIQAYAAYAFMRGRLDDAIRRWRSRGGKTPADTWAEQILAALYRAKGDARQAVVHARASEDIDVIEETLMWAGEWRDLADELHRDDRAADDPHHLALRVGINKLAGDDKAVDDDLIRLCAAAKRAESTDLAADTMLLVDRAPDAVKYLNDGGQFAAAYEILSDQRKFDECSALLARHDKETSEEAMALRATAAKSLAQLGLKPVAMELIERLARENAGPRSSRAYMLMGEAARTAGAMDKSWEYFEAAIEASRGDRRQYFTIVKAFPPEKSGVEWSALWYAALSRDAQRPVHVLFNRIRGAYDRSMPLDTLATAVTTVDFANEIERPYIELAWETARRKRAANNENDAVQWVRTLLFRVPTGDLEIHLGDWAVEEKDWPKAAAEYEAAWNKDRTRALPLYLLGWAMERSGQAAEGREQMALAHLLPVGDETRRADLVRGLYERGLDDDAMREADMTIRLGHPMTFYSEMAFRTVAERAEETGSYAMAGALWQRVMEDSLASSYAYQTHAMFLHLPNFARRLQARTKLAAGDFDGAKELINTSLQLLPIDGELVLEFVNDLDKAGRRADADELFARGFAGADGICRKFPDSAYEMNEAAWLAAKCDRQLDKAFDYATRAVHLDPENPAIIDTLAEVYFHRGDAAKAAELERKCVELSPLNPIHQHQLERFLSAAQKAKNAGK